MHAIRSKQTSQSRLINSSMEVERVRVQAIASSSLLNDTIPAEFIRPEKEQPAATTFRGGATPEIPTIDLGDPDEENIVRLIASASKEWGIFQVVNHGIPAEVVRKLQSAGEEFFGLPAEEKEVYGKPEGAESVEGYGTKLQKIVDGKKSWGDHLFHMIWPPSCINYRFWPRNPPFYREANEEYAKHMREVAKKLFRYLSLGLGVEEDVVEAAVGGEEVQYLLKINYYPPCPRPDLALGVVAHTDVSSITLLVPNHVPGLQVLKDDHWIHANYIPNALIVHIGDQIQILSNGKYKSVMHRTTVDKENARMSWPVFLQPPPEWVVGPLPQLVSEDDPPKYKPNKFKDYMYCKLNKIPL